MEIIKFIVDLIKEGKISLYELISALIVVTSYHLVIVKPHNSRSKDSIDEKLNTIDIKIVDIDTKHSELGDVMDKKTSDRLKEMDRKIDDKFVTGIERITGAVEKVEQLFDVHTKHEEYRFDDINNTQKTIFTLITKNSDKLEQLQESLGNLASKMTEYKIRASSLSKDELSIVMREINETARVTAEVTCRTIKRIIKDDHVYMPTELLADTARKVNERREYEYTKFTQLGMSEMTVKNCRETDTETFAQGTEMLYGIYQKALPYKDKIDILEEYLKIQEDYFTDTFTSLWQRTFENKFILKS